MTCPRPPSQYVEKQGLNLGLLESVAQMLSSPQLPARPPRPLHTCVVHKVL